MDVVGGVGGGVLIVVMSVVAGAEPPAKRDKLAIIHKLGAFAAATRQAQGALGGADRVLSAPIGWIERVGRDTEAGLRAT